MISRKIPLNSSTLKFNGKEKPSIATILKYSMLMAPVSLTSMNKTQLRINDARITALPIKALAFLDKLLRKIPLIRKPISGRIGTNQRSCVKLFISI